MCRVPSKLCCLALAALPLPSLHAAERVNVVAEHVHSVRTVDAAPDTSTLLVFVVDDAGDPIDEVGVVVLAGRRKVGAGSSDARGRVLLTLPTKGEVTVSAAEAGFVPSVARSVTLQPGQLTALVLALEEAAPEDAPEDDPDEPAATPVPGAAPPPTAAAQPASGTTRAPAAPEVAPAPSRAAEEPVPNPR